MNILSKLRINAGKSRLSVKMARIRRKPLYLNLYHIRTIGIVWDASRPEDFSILTRFHQHMAEQNREVTILGFFLEKSCLTAIRQSGISPVSKKMN